MLKQKKMFLSYNLLVIKHLEELISPHFFSIQKSEIACYCPTYYYRFQKTFV